MSTEFYLLRRVCPHCGQSPAKHAIGTRTATASRGVAFMWALPWDKSKIDDELSKAADSQIVDEYGDTWTWEKFDTMVGSLPTTRL